MSRPPAEPAPAALPLTVVTGASAGIGAALARELSRRGRPVLAVARRDDRLRALAAEAQAAGGAVIHPLALDLAAPGAAARLLEVARSLGGAAWLVNNAGFGVYGRFERNDPARLAEMIRLNCESLVLVSHAFLPDLRARGDAAILNVASAAAFQPTPYMAIYGATKAFVLSFSEALAEELRGTGVFVGAFCPGPVTTEFGAVAGTGERFRDIPARLTAEQAAHEALAQLERREVVRVPTVLYGFTTRAVSFVPRALVRRLAGRVQRERT